VQKNYTFEFVACSAWHGMDGLQCSLATEEEHCGTNKSTRRSGHVVAADRYDPWTLSACGCLAEAAAATGGRTGAMYRFTIRT
jgi:hypothetical protein